jgi:serine/threonine protein kinase, bacterial
MQKNIRAYGLVLLMALGILSCKKSNDSNNSGTTNPGGTNTGVTPGDSTTGVSTFAGNVTSKGSLSTPTGICFDSQGNLYVTEVTNSDVKKIDASGNITVFTGQLSNPGCEDVGSTLTDPDGIWFAHDSIYVADHICSHVKTFSLTGTAKTYLFNNPNNYFQEPVGICVDNTGNVFIANAFGNEGVLEITPAGQVIEYGDGTQAVKDGSATTAEFGTMSSICADNNGNIYIADSHRIRRIANGTVTTLAGNDNLGAADGQGSAASFGGAMGLCTDSKGNVYIADINNSNIRMMTPGGQVTTIAGNGSAGYKEGAKGQAQFSAPSGVCVDTKGNLFVADYGNNVIRKIVL